MPSSVIVALHRTPLAVVLSALVACGHVPSTQVTAQPAPRLSVETSDALPDHWWQLYRDPQLDALVEKALRENKDLEAAGAHVDALLAQLQQFEGERRASTTLYSCSSPPRQ